MFEQCITTVLLKCHFLGTSTEFIYLKNTEILTTNEKQSLTVRIKRLFSPPSFLPSLLHDNLTHQSTFFFFSIPLSFSNYFFSLPACGPPWNGSTTHFVVFALCGRYFHSPTDTKELLYDPASVMNGDTLKFCLKEAWCKLSFFVLSFFYYLYW